VQGGTGLVVRPRGDAYAVAMPDPTVRDAIDRARAAYASLGALGETIDEEWSYVTDLGDAWGARFDDVASARGEDAIGPEASRAIDRAIDEIGRIADPHRAIDWLSTFPQVVLVALGERP
jgi:hypothetical protein